MKLKIGKYEVEIKANLDGNEEGNLEDTKAFLNLVSSAFWSASAENMRAGLDGCADFHRDMANDIYDHLDEMGFYDGWKVY